MVLIAVTCPYCQSDDIAKRDKTDTGKQRYRCQNPNCHHQSFLLDPAYKGRLPRPFGWSANVQRWQHRRLGPRLLALVCLSILLGTTGRSEHIPQLNWMAPYRAVDGASCCGINDCFKAQLTMMSEPVNEQVRVRVTSLEDWAHRQFWIDAEVIVPQSSIHRSQDEHSWYCSNRHFQTWNVFGETTNRTCYTHESYDVRTECVRCIFLNVGA